MKLEVSLDHVLRSTAEMSHILRAITVAVKAAATTVSAITHRLELASSNHTYNLKTVVLKLDYSRILSYAEYDVLRVGASYL